MMVLMGVTILLLATHASYIYMAVTGPDATILDCISELLNPQECHELYIRIAVSQKDAKEPLEEKDLFPSGQWQEISSVAQCKEALNYWLEMERGAVNWDRLAQALRQIGRPDVSRELKKSLNRNRSLEPKWNVEENHTVEAVKSALLIQNEAHGQRRHHGLIQKALPKESSWDLRTSFMSLRLPWYNLSLQDCIGPAIQIILASFLTGLVVWLVSVYYIICWNMGQSLFPKRVHCGTSPTRQNMFFTMILNDQSNEDSWDDGEEEEDPNTSEYEEATEDEC